MHHLVSRLIIIVSLMSGLSGCASTGAIEESPTRGLRLEMTVHDADNLAELYRVDREGVLSFGGGRDAMLDTTSWSGRMSDDAIAALLALLDEHDWIARPPRSTGEPSSRRVRVSISRPDGQRRFTVRGAAPEVEAVRDLLSEQADARLEADLLRLPQPNVPSPVDDDQPAADDDDPPPDRVVSSSGGGTGVPPVEIGGTGVPPVEIGGTGVPPVEISPDEDTTPDRF